MARKKQDQCDFQKSRIEFVIGRVRTNQCILDPLQKLTMKKLVTQEAATIQFGIRGKYCPDAVWVDWRNFLTHQEALWYAVHEIS